LELIYYEDVELHRKISIGEHYVDRNEMIEYAKKWDPMPFHVDAELAKSYPFGGLIAPATYTLAVTRRLSTMSEKPRLAMLVGMGYEEIRLPNPVRPGDKLVVTEEYIEKRESQTNQKCGIIHKLIEVKNHSDEVCLSAVATVLVFKRSV